MNTRILPLLVLAVIGITGGSVSGQNRRGDRRQELEFDRRREGTGEQSEQGPEQALAEMLPRMIQWPGSGGENAIRGLLARFEPEELQAPLLEILRRGTVLEKAAAARALCLIGSDEAVHFIEQLFYDPRQARRWGALLDSVAEMDAETADAWSLKFLDSDPAGLRKAAVHHLRRRGSDQVKVAVRNILDGTGSDAVRLEAFELLQELADEELLPRALALIGHRHAALAAEVADYLSWRRDEDVSLRLHELASTDQDRQGPYAWMILAAQERHFGDPVLPDSLFEQCLEQVRSSDPLLQAAASIACGAIGYRRPDLERVTQDKVLPALMEVVLRGRLFPDFRYCFRQTLGVVEQLTGERLGESIPAWREYWREHVGGEFKIRRELKTLRMDADPAATRVELEKVDAVGQFEVVLTLLGENYRTRVVDDGEFAGILLPFADMRELLESLLDAGLFHEELRRELLELQPGAQRVRLEVRGKERSVVAPPGDEILAAMFELAITAAERQWWQRLLPRDETFVRRFQEEEAWFATHPDVPDRIRHTFDLALQQVESEDPERGLEVLGMLADREHLARWVEVQQVEQLAQVMAMLPLRDSRTQRLFDFLLSTRRPEVLDAVATALAPKGAAALEWLTTAVRQLGLEGAALVDRRALVRLAAVEALAIAPDDHLPQLFELAGADRDPAVQARALEVVADLGGAEGVTRVLAVLEEGDDTDRRRAALRALGFSSDPRATAALVEALEGEDESLAYAAVEGLSRQGNQDAASALEAVVLQRPVEDTVARLALRGIGRLPRELAVEVLRRVEAVGPADTAREATYGLADLGEMEAVPQLLEDLRDDGRQRRAITLLTVLFCRDFATEPWRFRSLYEADPDLDHEGHFLQVLREDGIDVPPGASALDASLQPLLVQVLGDERWFVRRAALDFLERSTGRDLGDLSVRASDAEIADMTRRWRAALRDQARGDTQVPERVP